MKSRTPFALLGCALIGAIVYAQSAWFSDSTTAVNISRDGVQTLKNGWVMLPPEPVMGDVELSSWSPNAQNLLIACRSLKPEVEAALIDLTNVGAKPDPPAPLRLGIVNPKTLQTKWVTEVPGNMIYLDIDWAGTTDIALISWNEGMDKFGNVVIHANSGKVLNLFPKDSDVLFQSLGQGRTLATGGTAQGRTEVRVLDQRGNVISSPKGLEEALQTWAFGGWSEKHGIMLYTGNSAAVLLSDGRVQALSMEIYRNEWRAAREVGIDEVGPELVVDYRGEMPRREAWLKANPDVTAQPLSLISTGVTDADISPTMSCVTFMQNRMLWVRRLVKIDLEAYVIARKIATKADAMMKAKQVGVALTIYGADYDDLLPNGNFVDSVMPYIKNREMLSGFTFILDGGDLTKLKPEDEMGYIETPDGRAVVRVDGSVVWKPKQ